MSLLNGMSTKGIAFTAEVHVQDRGLFTIKLNFIYFILFVLTLKLTNTKLTYAIKIAVTKFCHANLRQLPI